MTEQDSTRPWREYENAMVHMKDQQPYEGHVKVYENGWVEVPSEGELLNSDIVEAITEL